MGAYISMGSDVGGRALIGAWALKGTNTVTHCILGNFSCFFVVC